MKLSIVRLVRQGALALLCTSVLASSGTAFAATADTQGQSATTSTYNTSVNWSGYVASGHTFNKVQGDITVPTITCTVPGAISTFWVGFDGYDNSTVEQVGVGAECNGTTPDYFAWWEMWHPTPNNGRNGTAMHRLSASTLKVTPGNRVAAIVTYSPSTKRYDLQLYNTTTKQKSFSTTQVCSAGYACNRQTAEWIAEHGALLTPLTRP